MSEGRWQGRAMNLQQVPKLGRQHIEPQYFLNLNFPNHLSLEICFMFDQIRIASQTWVTGHLYWGF